MYIKNKTCCMLLIFTKLNSLHSNLQLFSVQVPKLEHLVVKQLTNNKFISINKGPENNSLLYCQALAARTRNRVIFQHNPTHL
jgi:hypothetical protein